MTVERPPSKSGLNQLASMFVKQKYRENYHERCSGLYKSIPKPRFLCYPKASYTPVKIEEPLSAGLEFPDLRIVIVEAENPILGINGLITRLEERPSH